MTPSCVRSLLRVTLAAVLLLACTSAAFALAIPPKPTAWVNDYGANLLSSSETQSLNERLEGLYKRTGTQFLIMIFPSLEGEDDLGYTNRVANEWKVTGDKALILFVFVKEHKARIQVGYGLEAVITDAFSSDVIRNTLRPYFRQQQYGQGLSAAVDQLASKIEPGAAGTDTSPATRPGRRPGQARASGTDMIFLVIFVLFVLFVLLPLMRRGGCRGCGGCWWPMFFLGGGGGGTTFGSGGGGGGWSTGGSWGSGSSFGGGGAGGGW